MVYVILRHSSTILNSLDIVTWGITTAIQQTVKQLLKLTN